MILPPPAAADRPWLWALLGACGTALAGVAGWLLLRRRRPVEQAEVAVTAPAPVPAPPPPLPPVATDPFELTLQPLRIHFTDREILLDCEVLIGNPSPAAADAIRLSVAMLSANPEQDLQIAALQSGPQLISSAEPFDLAAGAGGRLPMRFSLPREHMHVVTVGARPMFVPLVLVDLRWRGGLSIRRFGASFMIGTGGQGGKLGPIWLDRAAPTGALAANRYFPAARTQ